MRNTLRRPAPVAALALSPMVAAIAAAPLAPQTTDTPTSYVASVKRNMSGRGMIQLTPGGLRVVGMPVRILIRQAYGPLQEFQLVGGPGWMDSDRFDIEVRLEGGASLPAPALMRLVLEDRFKLKAHTESRELPIYELVLARADGRLGPRLTPSAPECVAMVENGARGRGQQPAGRGAPPLDGRGPDGRGRRGLSPQGAAAGEPPPCGSRSGGFGRFRAGGTTMAQLAASLSGPAQRVVIDKTGLTGVFDVELTFSPARDQLPAGPPPPGAPPLEIDPDRPSLFTAVEEQLGLKLEARRGPVDVVVIDSIEQPSEN